MSGRLFENRNDGIDSFLNGGMNEFIMPVYYLTVNGQERKNENRSYLPINLLDVNASKSQTNSRKEQPSSLS